MFRPRKFVSKCVLVSLSAVAAANSVGGCAQHVDDEAVVETSEALSSTPAGRISQTMPAWGTAKPLTETGSASIEPPNTSPMIGIAPATRSTVVSSR